MMQLGCSNFGSTEAQAEALRCCLDRENRKPERSVRTLTRRPLLRGQAGAPAQCSETRIAAKHRHLRVNQNPSHMVRLDKSHPL